MIPSIALYNYTTSHAHDGFGFGPEYEGRQIVITWLGWTFEIALCRRVKEVRR